MTTASEELQAMSVDDRNPPPPPCTFQPCRPDDLPRLARLDRLCFSPELAYDRLELSFYLARPDTLCLTAELDRSLAGFIILTAPVPPGTAQIITIDVHPRFRRRGIGRQLIGRAEELVARRNGRRLSLQVALDNRGAQAFYRTLGFRRTGRIAQYYPGGIDALVLEKSLSA